MGETSETTAGIPATGVEAEAATPEPERLSGAEGDANFATPDGGGAGPAPEAQPGAPEAPAAPESYELAAPEGMALDEAMLAEFTPVARELGLSNEQAQELADAYARRMQALADGQVEDWNRQTETLAEAVLKDREIGGDTAGFAAKRAVMKRGLASLGDAELGRAVEEGRPIHPNSPGLLRALYRLGRAAAEDGFAEGGLAAAPPGSGPQAWARSLYPTLTQPTAKE